VRSVIPPWRECLAEPIPECFEAAALLSAAVDAHLAGQHYEAAQLIVAANLPAVRSFTEAVWGAGGKKRHGFVTIPNAPPKMPVAACPMPRMPNLQTQKAVLVRDGHHCRFCGLPVIRKPVRQMLRKAYPDALGWGSTNASQHAAFQCLWLQFDHVLPNCRGGTSDRENVIVTCAPCNFGRMETTLAEARLIDPLSRPTPIKWDGFHTWDGLERLTTKI
jgi:5-methylcytosine-specific restriction endonuclease McrA